MPQMLRIVAAGMLLCGATVAAPAQAAAPSRILPRAMHPVKVEPCKPTWPYLVRTCLA